MQCNDLLGLVGKGGWLGRGEGGGYMDLEPVTFLVKHITRALGVRGIFLSADCMQICGSSLSPSDTSSYPQAMSR